MPIAKLMVVLIALNGSATLAQEHFIPTSEVVRVSKMAAQDEGYSLATATFYLDELRTKEGREPIAGYTSIGLYKGGRLLHAYAIRVLTGDIVDTQSCTIFRYANLLRFRDETTKVFSSKQSSLDQIASEVGCDHLTVKPVKKGK